MECLKGAHNARVVHRGVRPDNIMQDTTGKIRLIDWGFAYMKLSASSFPGLEGTFRYASHEVLESAISSQSREPMACDDLHSLVRVILSQMQPSMQDELARIAPGDFVAAKSYWSEKRAKNQRYKWVFCKANARDYDGLKDIMLDDSSIKSRMCLRHLPRKLAWAALLLLKSEFGAGNDVF
mmetsp:Transcript_17411/g.26438  ORF Transcript_17411/g.26438 Transcript_17411/m.26438 type:complete len:181 (-) Transcript_17411:180-722(-)